MYLKLLYKAFLHNNVSQVLLSSFVVFIPISQRISTIILVLLFLTTIFKFFKSERGRMNINFLILIPVCFFALCFFSLFYSDQVEFKFIEQKASFLAFPIIFYFLKINDRNVRKLLMFFVLGCLIASLLLIINAIYNSILFDNNGIGFQASVNPSFSFWYAIVRDGNYFFSTHFSIFHDPLYFSFYLNVSISIVLCFSLWKENRIYLVLLLLFPIVIFLNSSRLGIGCCILIYIYYLVSRLKGYTLKALIFLSLISIGLYVMNFNPRGEIMIRDLKNNGLRISPEERYGYPLRLMSWESAVDIIKKNPIFGVGIGDAQSELNKVYNFKGYIYPLKYKLNVHNQFLQTYIEVGYFGFILLLIMISLLIIRMPVNLNNFGYYFFFLTFILFFFESALNRYSGISVFVLFYCFIVYKPVEE
ncbi:O-antigen ligase family protein [Galbibacter sp. BG1]|uniref:O-antigen ligase family protein n=1 Tax=Galbibacter sp. BG1 TaxID=1170699 RepID=UPI0015BE3126|nr:O-antigen ligase family protein [Galbibacter sp. BG1]QLE02360.1 O-antigen ligase family protein [Galbibacter sp. BG1]